MVHDAALSSIPLDFDVRSLEITSNEGDDYSEAAWEVDREEHLFWESVERASRFPLAPVPITAGDKHGFPAMLVKVVKGSHHRPRAARPWIPSAFTVCPMTRVEARADEGAIPATTEGPCLG